MLQAATAKAPGKPTTSGLSPTLRKAPKAVLSPIPAVGKYMLRPALALARLTFLEPEGKVGYRYGEKGAEQETMDYLEFIDRVTSHIPDKGQVMVRYFGSMRTSAFIDHLKLGFVADRPPLSPVFEQVALPAAEESGEYF
jgi:hypothetical protein